MPSRPRVVALACLVLAAAAGFSVAGPILYRSAIGLAPQAFPAGELLQRIGRTVLPGLEVTVAGVVLGSAVVLAVALATFVAVRSAGRAGLDAADAGRRGFLAGAGSATGAAIAALVAAGAASFARAFYGIGNGGRGWAPVASEIFAASVVKTDPNPKDAWTGSRVRAWRRLGRTEWRVSDIVLGTGQIRGDTGEHVARLALERGVNYFDTAPDYAGSGSEQAMGRALATVAREQVFVATKFCTPEGHLPANAPVAAYLEAIEGSLRRLATDYVDLVHIHSCDEVDRLLSENAHEAFDRLKQQGKARFLGFSSHTPNLVQVATRAIESGRFDVMMLAVHHGIWPQIPEIIARARAQQDMGVVAMKTLKGARQRGLAETRDQADAYSQAAFKWVLSNPDVSCAVVSFSVPQHVDEYLYASGRSLTPEDVTHLEDYDRKILGTYCAPHCGQCLSSCPEALPIHDVLRYRMYFEDYGQEKEAMRRYAGLERNAAVCQTCRAPCLGSCPLGVRIAERMAGAHRLLSPNERAARRSPS